MSRTRPVIPPRPHGWTLVELAVVLAIAALLAVVLLRTLAAGREASALPSADAQMAQAQEALLGFAQANSRLPAADGDGDGREDTGAGSGWLPVKTLSLPSRLRLRYFVPTSLTATPGNRYQPVWPATTAGQAGSHAAHLGAVQHVNGLDFCGGLADAQRSPQALAGLGMPAAFALTYPGPAGHGSNAAAMPTLPGGEAAAASPYPTLATGLGELAARLSCPDRVARVQGAAREAWAAADAILLAQVYLSFRELAKEQAELTKLNAATSVAFGAFDAAYGLATVALASSELAGDGGALAGVELAVAIAELANGATALGFAGSDLTSAIDGMRQADADYRNAEENLERMRVLAERARGNLITLDAAGLAP